MLNRARALAAIAAAPLAVSSRALAQPAPVIRMGAVASDTFAEPLYGVDSGLFSKAGLNVDLKVFPGSGAVAVAAAGNAVDIGLADAVTLSNANNRGVPLTAIAGGGLYVPGQATSFLCVARDSGIKSAKDFEGQAVAVVTLVSISRIAVEAWLAKNGADVSKVRFIEMPFPEQPAAITQRRVAGAFLAEPILSQRGPDVTILADAYSAIGNRFSISNWFTTHDWLTQNPDLAKRLVKAIYDVAGWANSHRDQTAPVLAKYAKIDPEKVKAMRRCPYGTSLTPGMLQPVIDAGVTYKAIEHAVNASDLIAKV